MAEGVLSPEVNLEYDSTLTAFDIIEAMDIPISDLLKLGDRIIFKVADRYISTMISSIEESLLNKEETSYECRAELDGKKAFVKNAYIRTPYFRLRLHAIFNIPEEQINVALKSKYSIFEIIPDEKRIGFSTSHKSVRLTLAPNGSPLRNVFGNLGQRLCDKLSQQLTYKLRGVILVKQSNASASASASASARNRRKQTKQRQRKRMGRKTQRRYKTKL